MSGTRDKIRNQGKGAEQKRGKVETKMEGMGELWKVEGKV